jgi:hypothetical protein
MPNYEEINDYYSHDNLIEVNFIYENNYENDDEDYHYDPEEKSNTKYNLINYEIYNPFIHGKANRLLYTQLLVCDRYKYCDTSSIENIINEGVTINNIVTESILSMPKCEHPFIRNFINIVFKTSGNLEIAECIYLEGDVMCAILKTFWLKIIQRKWKNILKERNRINRLRMRIASIIYREINGSWPPECKYMPSLRGMLSNLL